MCVSFLLIRAFIFMVQAEHKHKYIYFYFFFTQNFPNFLFFFGSCCGGGGEEGMCRIFERSEYHLAHSPVRKA